MKNIGRIGHIRLIGRISSSNRISGLLRPILRVYHRLPKIARRLVVALLIFAIATPFYLFTSLFQKPAQAAWFDENWAYREAIPATSTEGSAQTNVFLSFTLDTATLITNSKLQSSCQDIRITDVGGKLLKHHIGRSTACNNAATVIDFLLPSFPDGKSTYYVYYGNSVAASADAGTLTVSAASASTVTASGNEITDAVRTTNTQGDGVTPPDSSYGIWQAATNVVLNGGIETNATNWAIRNPADSIARSTVQAKFGVASLAITLGATTFGGGFANQTNCPVSESTQYTVSWWTYRGSASGVPALTYEINDQSENQIAAAAMATTTDAWFRTVVTITTGVGDTGLRVHVRKGAGSETGTFYVDGLQVETGAIATPYIQTDGGTASRSAARIQAPVANTLNTTQGWVAMRVRTGFTNTFSGSEPTYFDWVDDANNYVRLRWEPSNNFKMTRVAASSGVEAVTGGGTFAVGDTLTLIGTWESGQVKVSKNGAAFATAAGANIPTLAATQFDIATRANTNHINSDVLWFASGTGTLTNADATTINGYGNTDPTTTQLAALNSGIANSTFLWTADTSADTQTLISQGTARNYTIGSLATEEKGPGPVAYWNFDEGTGTTAKDSSINANNATLGGTTIPTWQAEDQCISGKCLYFDGATSKVTGSKVAKNIQTISFWMRPNTIASQGLLNLDGGTHKISTNSSGVISAVGFASPTYYINGIATTTPTLVQNKWNFVSVTTGTGFDSTTSFTIGTDGTNFIKGFFDEPKFYNYARTAAQILADYNSRGSSPAGANILGIKDQAYLSNGLVGYWKMNESSWTNNCSTTSVTDSSGNGNNGTACPNATGPTGGAAGKFGSAGSFDSSDDYIDTNKTRSQIGIVDSYTISAWLNPTTVSADKGAVGTWNGNGTFIGLGTGGVWTFAASTNVSAFVASDTVAASASTWTLVTATAKLGDTVKIYVNGVEKASTSIATSTSFFGGLSFKIGDRGDTFFPNKFAGSIDEARIYSRALSPAEVSQLYNFAPGPVANWNFDEGSGTAVNDITGNANTGTWAGTLGSQWKQGKYGSAGSFNGSNNAVIKTSPSNMTWSSASTFTIEAYINVTSNNAAYREIVRKGHTGSAWFLLLNSSNKVALSTSGAAGEYDNGFAYTADGKWHHVAGTFDGTTIYMYLDGVFKTSYSGATPSTNTSDLAIGCTGNGAGGCTADPFGQFFPGLIDEVKIYNYARTQKQIVEDMNAGHPAGGSPVGSQVGYWKFDEGYGTTGNDSGSQAILGSANNLTLSSTSWTSSGKFDKAWNGTGALWLSRSDDNDFDFAAADDMAISLWFKSDSASNPGTTEYLVTKGPTAAVGYAVYANTSGNICFGIDDDTASFPEDSACSTGDIYDGTWHHIVAEKTGTTRLDLYVDGRSNATDTAISATGTLANASTLYIGDLDGIDNGSEFNGDLDELKFFRAILTASEVGIDYNHGASQVLGATSTASNGITADNSASRAYCVPGDTSTCSAPVGEWNFNENQGSSVNDITGNGNLGTWAGTAQWTQGKYGSAGNFTSSSNYVNVGNSSTLNPSSTMTIEAWAYPTSIPGSDNYVVSRYYTSGDATTDYDLEARNTGVWQFVIQQSNLVAKGSTGGTVTLNAWNHVVATADGSNTRLYVNGVLVSTNSYDGTINTSTRSTLIGRNRVEDPNGPWFGRIDDVKIFNYARSAAQVAWDYNRGGPVGWWKLDECQGTVANDSSGNANTGTITIGAAGSQTVAGTCLTPTNGTGAWYNGVTGKRNYSLNFDNNDDKVSISDNASLNLTTNFTFTAWVKRASTGGFDAIYQSGTQANYWLVTVDANNKIDFAERNIADNFANTSINTNWHQIAIVKNGDSGTNITFYLDGVADGTASVGTVSTPTGGKLIGKWSEDNTVTMNGQIDDVRVYNYALTKPQVQTLYNNGTVNFAPVTGSP